MKKKRTIQNIPEFRPPRLGEPTKPGTWAHEYQKRVNKLKTEWPFDQNLSAKERLNLIVKSIKEAIKNEMRLETFIPQEFFDKQAPKPEACRQLRKQFESYIPLNTKDWVKQEKVFKLPGVHTFHKIPRTHYAKLMVYLDRLDIKYLWKIKEFRDSLPFWHAIFIAYYSCGLPQYGKPYRNPFFILKPPSKVNEELEDLLNKNQELRLHSKNAQYPESSVKKWGGVVYYKGGRKIGPLLEVLRQYPGTYADQRRAWGLYDRIMGSQGTLEGMKDSSFLQDQSNTDEETYQPFKFFTHPGFVHLLVNQLALIDKGKKYELAHDFLVAYLGVEELDKDFNVRTIKDHLQSSRQKAK